MEDTIKGIMYGMVMFIVMISAGVALLSIVNNNSDSTPIIDPRQEMFNRTFNKYADLQSATDGFVTDINSTDTDYNPLNSITGLWNNIWKGMKAMFASFDFVTSIIKAVPSMFPDIPSWFIGLMVMLFLITIVISIWSMILGRNP